jgi:hypothetical protein
MLQSQNYDLQQLTMLEGFMCIKNHEMREWKSIQKHSTIYYFLTLSNHHLTLT